MTRISNIRAINTGFGPSGLMVLFNLGLVWDEGNNPENKQPGGGGDFNCFVFT
jgi:hypothetical protein